MVHCRPDRAYKYDAIMFNILYICFSFVLHILKIFMQLNSAFFFYLHFTVFNTIGEEFMQVPLSSCFTINFDVVADSVAGQCDGGMETVEISTNVVSVFLAYLRILWYFGSQSICESSR